MARVLVVEDEMSLNLAFKIILEAEGHAVRSAFDGQEALDLLEQEEPELILLDLLMPHMGGLEFLRHIDLPKNYPKMKVIVFSNLEMQKDIDEAYKLGADKYILKAWAAPKQLAKLVEDTLAKKK